MNTRTSTVVAADWIAAANAKDGKALLALLAEDVVLNPPFQGEPIYGRGSVLATFAAFAAVTENFVYGRSWSSDSAVLLEFHADIDGEPIQAIDLLTLDAGGKIVRFDVMARPASSALALGAAIHCLASNVTNG